MIDLEKKLKAKFPPDAISFRANNVKSDGTAALALAYIDARDVMNRLDEVCGIEGWQARYSHADKKTICEIGIKINDAWVWKANGAGDSDIEAEKGAVSDAFKRAAVLWGIGRYLYQDEYKNLWVDCESTMINGKPKFRKWKIEPYLKVKQAKAEKSTITTQVIKEQAKAIVKSPDNKLDNVVNQIEKINDISELAILHKNTTEFLSILKNQCQQSFNDLQGKFQTKKNQLMQPQTVTQAMRQQ